MRIEEIRLKNFRAFKDVTMRDIPPFCVLIGANGTGKSTLFAVFEFLHNALTSNVNTALVKLGGPKGIQEVRTRGETGDIEITIKFREQPSEENKRPRLVTYQLSIGEENGSPIVKKEILQYRRGNRGKPWKYLDFANGEGQAVTNEFDVGFDESKLDREHQKLKSNDILAVKGLAQFEQYPAVVALGNLIENWHISDFHINQARPEQQPSHAEHLSESGDNLSLVIDFLYHRHREVYDEICTRIAQRVPGIESVESKITEDGRVLLRFKDNSFEEPFLARYASDGTIKMLAYLVLLHDPAPFPLLCVEEPENQLYPELLQELAEEFRAYSDRGRQVFVSTHSFEFLNEAKLEEVFVLMKEKGHTKILRASDNEQVAAYMKDGDHMGALWREGFFQAFFFQPQGETATS